MFSSILKNIGLQGFQDFLFQLLGLLQFVIIARVGGALDVGVYSYIWAINSLLSLLLDFGVNQHYWRMWTVSSINKKSDLQNVVAQKIFFSLFLLLPLLIYTIYFEEYKFLFIVAFSSTVFDLLRQAYVYSLQAENLFSMSVKLNFIDKLSSLLVGIPLYLTTSNLEWIFIGALVGKFISSLFLFQSTGLFIPKMNISNISAIAGESVGMFVLSTLHVIYFRSDSIIIKWFLGSSNLGEYSTVYKIYETITLIPTIIFISALPSISKSLQNSEKLSSLSSLLIKFLLLISLFISSSLIISSRQILDFLYRGSFYTSYQVLETLALALPFYFITAVPTAILIAKRKDKQIIYRLLFLVLFNIISNMLLIPYMGIRAAALVTLITEIMSAIILFAQSKVNISFIYEKRFVVLIAYCLLPKLLFSHTGFLMQLVFTCGFLLLLFATQIVTKKDFRSAFSLLKSSRDS